MGGQFHELLLDVSAKLAGIERLLSDIREREGNLERAIGDLKERIVKIEMAEKWMGQDRRKVDGRLQTGDSRFQTIERDVAELRRVVDWCKQQVEPKPTSWRKKLIKPLIEVAAPVFVGLVWWLFYHFLLIGPEIAKMMKAMKDMGGHP